MKVMKILYIVLIFAGFIALCIFHILRQAKLQKSALRKIVRMLEEDPSRQISGNDLRNMLCLMGIKLSRPAFYFCMSKLVKCHSVKEMPTQSNNEGNHATKREYRFIPRGVENLEFELETDSFVS